METQLYFWKPQIEIYKKELSLVEDYYNRTKKQFNDIENEANDCANLIYKNYAGNEDTDPASIAELAKEKSIELFEFLLLMKSNHLLMTIVMLHHTWEQQLIRFVKCELKNYIEFGRIILEIYDIKKVFKLHGIDIEEKKSWKKINELRLLANTIKHGEGRSAKDLRKIRPDFFKSNLLDEIDTLDFAEAVLIDETSLQVKENDLNDYVKAVTMFWDEMPERAFCKIDILIEALNRKEKRINNAINQEIKDGYSQFDKDFNILENLQIEYNERFFTKVNCLKEKPKRLLGHNGIIFLQHSLTRSNNLYLGFINCINNTNRSLSFFAVRAQFEVTASIAYLLKNLKKFYSKQMSYEKIDDILYKLSLGGRVFPDKNLTPEFPEAINILTLIDSADIIFKEYRDKDSKPFKESYDFLSEFCHPNMLGLTIGSKIIEEGIIKFNKNPCLDDGDYGILLNYNIMSIEYFFSLFDECFNLIKENEDIPYLEK